MECKKTIIYREQLDIEPIGEKGGGQYYIKAFGRNVGYIHVRNHYMEAMCPDESGDTVVYEAETEGWYDFEDWEREYHLMKSKIEVTRWLEENGYWFFSNQKTSDNQ